MVSKTLIGQTNTRKKTSSKGQIRIELKKKSFLPKQAKMERLC